MPEEGLPRQADLGEDVGQRFTRDRVTGGYRDECRAALHPKHIGSFVKTKHPALLERACALNSRATRKVVHEVCPRASPPLRGAEGSIGLEREKLREGSLGIHGRCERPKHVAFQLQRAFWSRSPRSAGPVQRTVHAPCVALVRRIARTPRRCARHAHHRRGVLCAPGGPISNRK